MTIQSTAPTVQLQYIGDKRGTQSVRGPISKKWYSFGASPVNRVITVDKADAEYLLRRRDFYLIPPPTQPTLAAGGVAAPQARPMPQPTTKKPVSLEEEAPADDLSEIGGITEDTQGVLALIGVRTFKDLAGLESIKAAAELTGKSEKQVKKWIEAARKKLEPEVKDDFGGFDSGELGDLGADLPDDV